MKRTQFGFLIGQLYQMNADLIYFTADWILQSYFRVWMWDVKPGKVSSDQRSADSFPYAVRPIANRTVDSTDDFLAFV